LDIGQLHQFLGELIKAGIDPRLPAVLPGKSPDDDLPQELCMAMIIEGRFQVDPAPLAKGYTEDEGRALMLSGVGYDTGVLEETHRTEWPPVDAPQPDRLVRTRHEL